MASTPVGTQPSAVSPHVCHPGRHHIPRKRPQRPHRPSHHPRRRDRTTSPPRILLRVHTRSRNHRRTPNRRQSTHLRGALHPARCYRTCAVAHLHEDHHPRGKGKNRRRDWGFSLHHHLRPYTLITPTQRHRRAPRWHAAQVSTPRRKTLPDRVAESHLRHRHPRRRHQRTHPHRPHDRAHQI